jgi:hypothetical protein
VAGVLAEFLYLQEDRPFLFLPFPEVIDC